MKKRAFTLLEILVVTAIIGVLMAFIMPAVSRMRGGARRAMCANNLRQIGIACRIYVEDHNNKFPSKYITIGETTTYWWDYLSDYIDNPDVWKCPNYKGSIAFSTKYCSYAYNFRLLNEFPIHYGKDITSVPTQCMMATDSSNFDFAGQERGTWYIWKRHADSNPGDRHSGGTNVLFVDGHVAWCLQSFLITEGEKGYEEWWGY